ncbi:MAG: hypothetical protein IK066_10230, partial [Kiritimatiellae bacterium]|nr:hypothetical protein [Kiritimatiellia bacterium]
MRTRTSVAIWTGVLLAASNAWAALTWSTAVQSPPVRYDIRSTFGGKLVAGTVAIGDADGGAVAAWDTTALADGWNPCTSGANATDLYVLNSAACAIEEGRLAASASWGTDVTHVVRHWVVVPSGKTLTIEAGAVVKFCPETGIRIEDGGKLLILSDAENETILASVAADDWGAVLADTGVEDATAGRIVLQTSSAQLVEMGGHVRLFNVSMPQIPTVSVQSTTAVRGGGMAYVPFAISGGTRTNEFSVDWEAVDGTATYGDDYLLASGTVTWANSSAGTKTVAIPLNTEHVTGEKTTFTVRLVAAHSAYLSSTASTGTVTITERNTLDMTWSAAASASAPSRFDSRASFSGHLVTGTEPIGEPGGEAVTAWDTTSAANGWTDVEAADASATESLYVFNDSGVTVEGGRLAGTATWSNDVTHLVRHWVVIPRGVTLNVTAGTVVKFCPDTGIRIEDGGRLSVIGEEGNDAIFTSVNDDTAGVAIPATEVEGKPGRIVLQSSSAQFYDNGFLQVRFGYGAYPSVTVQDSSAFRSMGVAYVLFTVGGTTRTNRFSVDWRAVDGTATYGADYLLATGTVTWASSSAGTKTVAIPLNATNVAGEIKSFTIQIVTNRSVNVADGEANVEIRELDFLPLVWGNGAAEAARYDTRTNFGGTLVTAVQPIGEPDGSALLRWNTAELADGWHEVNAASGSASAALYSLNDPEIAIEGGRVPAGSTTWGSNVTHLVRHDIVIPSGATLNLAAGAVVKFCPGTRIYIQDGGTLNIAGAADANVIFTGINDDEAGKEVVGTGIDPALRIGAIVKQSSSAKITDTGYLQVQNINAVAGYPSIRLNDAVADRANGFAWIPVTLSGDSRSTRFDIDWETVDGTARFGTDYLMATGHIDWASTSQGTKWIQLPLDTTPTGERRQFQVRIKTARAANIVGKYAYVDIYELDSAKVESFDVRLWTNTVDEAECAIDTEIVETPWIDDDVLDIRYSPTWQDEVPADEAYAEVSLETDDGVTLLARGDPGESGFVTLDMNTIPYGVYTLRHKIFDADGNLLGAYLKDFLYLDPDSTEVHFGELTSNETWRADKVHVVYGTVSVPAIYTLFFEPGAIVKFFTGASIRLASGAALFANDVVFTHVSDDTVGGDTCFDGFAQKPVLDAYSFSGSVTLGQDCDLRYITIKTSIPASITTDYTLYRGAIYEVTNNVTVQSGATLTIHPGTILKFATNTALNVASGGRLSAIGSRAAPIVFTSIRDDEHGGDSNHDGEATVPQPGDWVKISTSGDAEAIFRHCQILYSSRNSTTGAINMNGGTVELTDSIIAHGLYDAVGVESGNFFMTNSVIWDCLTAFRHWPRDPIVNSVFYDCGRLTQGGDQHFVNCVFSKITDTWEAFGFPRSTYTNCVFWNEEGSVLTGEGTQDAMTVCGQNGNIWGDPLFVDPEHADFRILIDSPCVDAADSLVAPAADHFGQPRFTFAGGEPAGIPDESGAYADIGLCELQLRAVTSGHDISAVAVKTVGDIRPGNPLCVQWVVGNDGEEALEENWRDTLSLVSENGDIVELGEKFHLGTIQAGGEYNAMDWFEVPALAEGNWRARLVANAYRDVYEGALTNNNEAFSSAVYPVAATVVPASGGAFAVPAGATAFLRITGLTTDGGILSFASDRIQDLSVSRAFPSAEWPWTWRLDSALAGSLVIPSVSATNSVYLFVRNEGAFPTEVSTSLAPIVPAIDGFSPSALPAAFPAVLHLTGTALDRIESVALYDGNTRVAFATDVAHTSSVEAAATFDLSQVPPGSAYTVSAVIDGVSVAAPGTLAVAPAIDDGEVTAWLDLPDAVRDGRVFAGRIHYRNSGAADMLVPVFKLYATEATTRLAKRRDDEFLPVPLYLVGASPSFPQYVLKAGEETTIPFYFTMRGHYHLVLERLTTDTEINPAEFIARWWFREQQKLDTAAQRAANEAMRQEMLPAAIEAFRAEYERCCARTNIGYSIRGTASFADGTAAACETLAIYYAGGERGALQQTVTDEDGGFVFTTLGTGTNYCIQGVTVSVPHRDGIAIDGADVSGVAVEVSPRGCVRGVVRNAADTNVVYAGLTVFAQDGFKFVSETVTDENGEYAFRGLRFGDIAIQTDVPDGMAFGYAETRLDKDNLLAQVDFALGPGVDVTGTLYEDGTSEPVTNALLNLHDAETRLWTGTAITDDDGRFEFKAVPANSTVLVSVAGSAWRMADTSTSLAIGAESMETDLFVIEQALFEAFPTSGPVPLSVGFFLFDPGLTNQAASFAWDFDGDGQTDSSYANPLVRFGAPGTYDVSLVVTYTNGLVVTSKVDACVTTHEPLPTVYQPGVLVLLDGDEANTGDWAIDGYDGDNRILRLTALSSSPAITPAEGTPLVFKNEKGIYRWRRVSSVSSAGNAWTLATTNADSLSEIYYSFEFFESTLDNPELAGNAPAPARRGRKDPADNSGEGDEEGEEGGEGGEGGNGSGQQQNTTEVKGDLSNGKGSAQVHSQQSVSGENGPLTYEFHQETHASVECTVDGSVGRDDKSVSGRTTTSCKSEFETEGGASAGFHESWEKTGNPIEIADGTTITPWAQGSVDGDISMSWNASGSQEYTRTDEWSVSNDNSYDHSSHSSSSGNIDYGVEAQGHLGAEATIGFDINSEYVNGSFQVGVGVDCSATGTANGDGFSGSYGCEVTTGMEYTFNADNPTKWFDPTETIQNLADKAADEWNSQYNGAKDKALDELGGALDDMDKQLLDALNNYKNDLNVPDNLNVNDLLDPDLQEQLNDLNKIQNSDWPFPPDMTTEEIANQIALENHQFPIDTTSIETQIINEEVHENANEKFNEIVNQNLFCLPDFNNRLRKARPQRRGAANQLGILTPAQSDFAHKLGNGTPAFAQGLRRQADALVSRTVDYGDGTVETFTPGPSPQGRSGDRGDVPAGIPEQITHDYTHYGLYLVTVQDHYEHVSPPPIRFFVSVKDYDVGNFQFPTALQYAALPWLGTNYQVGVSDPWATNAATPLSAAFCLMAGLPPDPSIYEPADASPAARALLRRSGSRDSDGDGIPDVSELQNCTDPKNPEDPEDEPDPENPTEEEDEEEDDSVTSEDPNAVSGPEGCGDPGTERFVWAGKELEYTIFFENKADATADAQEVTIELPLDPAFDWESFEAETVVAGATVDDGLDGKQCATSQVYHAASGFDLRSSIVLDTEAGKAQWYLRVFDTNTFDGWPQDAFAGFLPPNDNTGRGEGHVTFRVKVRDGVEFGTRVTVAASIVFDYNEAIATEPSWWNTVSPPWYAVAFVDEDGSVLKKAVQYPEGTAADDIVQPAEPTKAADERWVYEFAGWTPPLAEVTTNATYGATYRAE